MSSSNDNRFDVIVIGSGAAGLCCATTLAQSGLRVLVAEKNDWIGGYSHGFSQDGFYWDHGGHVFLAYRLGGQARTLFQRLKLEERVEMVPDRHDYRCIFPDESIAIPADMTEAADIFTQRFPEERDGIARVLLIMESLIGEVDQFVPNFRATDKPGEKKALDPIMAQFERPVVAKTLGRLVGLGGMPGGNLTKYQFYTLGQMLDEHLKDPRLKAYFSMLAAGIGAPPKELSAVVAGVFFIHSLRTMWMPKGGFQKIAEGLAELFQEAGGTLLTGAEAERLIVTEGRVTGVETKDGRRFTAKAVVSASDARRTFLRMLEPEHVPAGFRQRLNTMQLSPSIFQVHLGTDLDLMPYREEIKRLNFVYSTHDIDKAMDQFKLGNVEDAAYFLYVATFHQPEMAPPGQHSIKLESYTQKHVPGIDWERDKERIAESFIRRTERIIPNLSKHIVAKAIRTPLDLERDTGNSEGAFAGWALTPSMLQRGRLQQRTPVPGLYLAGHWTVPTAGVPWVMLSGYNTAGMVMADMNYKPGSKS